MLSDKQPEMTEKPEMVETEEMAEKHEMIVKMLNGELISISFDSPEQQLMEIFVKIWETCGVEINMWIFENMENSDEKIVIDEYQSKWDFKNKEQSFVDAISYKKREGSRRKIDLRRFGRCNIMSVPKKNRNFCVYYDNKKNRVLCVDLNDLTFHKQIQELAFGTYGLVDIRNEEFRYIDYDSFMNHPRASTIFRAGSRVFESSSDKIDSYISGVLTGYKPSYICKVSRDNFNVNPLKPFLKPIK
jgi:hypothetical protein